MQDPSDSPPKTSSEAVAAPSRWRRRVLVSGLLVGASLVLAACGSSGSITTLNTRVIERAIAQSSLDQRGQRADVSCPTAVPQKKGLKFSCTAVVGSTSTRFLVVEQGDSGHVHYEAP